LRCLCLGCLRLWFGGSVIVDVGGRRVHGGGEMERDGVQRRHEGCSGLIKCRRRSSAAMMTTEVRSGGSEAEP
jgi:hypothetical protein